MKVIIKIYNKSKFIDDSTIIKEETYDIDDWDVIILNDEEALKLGFKEPDFNKEYIVLNFEDGKNLIFRCSYINMFKLIENQKRSGLK